MASFSTIGIYVPFLISESKAKGRGHKTARNPFYESTVLDTPEAVANMEKAFEKYEKEGGYKVKNQVVISNDYDCFDRILKKLKQ